MNIKDLTKDLQDSQRDAGWRIKTIPWQDSNKLEYVQNTPLSLMTGCGGALIFIGSIVLFIMEIAPMWVIGIGVAGLVLGIIGRRYAAWHKYRNWIPVKATCVDKEIREIVIPTKTGGNKVWAFRLQCTFNYNGKLFAVTPDTSYKIIHFYEQNDLLKHLAKTIDEDGRCNLWINPDKPLQCSFNKKPKI